MRIPFPERLPINRVAIFVAALFAIQQLEGTTLFFSTGCAVFLLIAAFAFNAGGGLARSSGAYVFFYTVLVVLIGLLYKAFLGEPAHSNLADPRTTIEAYVGSVAGMYAAILVSNRFARRTSLLQNLLPERDMYRASVGCIVFGVAGAILISFLGESASVLQSAFNQLNELIPLGIIIGVMVEIRRSEGMRSINLPTLLAIVYYFFFFGILGFSKQGVLLPVLCWLLPVCALRCRVSLLQIAGLLLFAFLTFYYLVPFAQYGRSLVPYNPTLSQKYDTAIPLLEHPEKTREDFEEVAEEAGYYDTPQGFWDRLQFISTDDGLIDFTDQGHVFGLWPITASFLNVIPRFLYPDKPSLAFGNTYSHEMGKLAENDTSTGISYSPTSEAYHMAKWTGVLVAAPLIWFLFFVCYDSLFGDLRNSPWGLLALVLISHVGPEEGITGLIYLASFGSEILIFCALFATWVAPLLSTVVLGPGQRSPVARAPLQPVPPSP